MKKHTSLICVVFLFSGCYSTAPVKNLNATETTAVLESMNGTYRTRDARENKYARIAAVDLYIRKGSGSVDVRQEDGRSYKLHLTTCELANEAQTRNSGKPVESVESLVRCDILSSYKYAAMYIGKVKSGYEISDQKAFKTFEPMRISTGYFITIKENVGSETKLSVTRE